MSIRLEDKLRSSWCLYHHDMKNEDWSLGSFRLVCKISTVGELLLTLDKFPTFQSDMFFLMRSDRPPVFNHDINKNGGIWTYKVQKRFCDEIIKRTIIATCMDVLSNRDIEHPTDIIGVSLSPKVSNLVIKLWIDNPDGRAAGVIFNEIDGLAHSLAKFKYNYEMTA